jgi:hypothetical protein
MAGKQVSGTSGKANISKLWSESLEKIATVECSELPCDKQNQSNDMLVELEEQCRDKSILYLDFNWEGVTN